MPPKSVPADSATDRTPAENPVLLLIDGHSLAYRSYYAFANSREGGLRTSTGIPTSVCYGFLNSLLDTMLLEQPQAIAVAFDLQGPTFRHEADANYKAGRAETPDDFPADLANLQSLLQALKISAVTAPRFEADDVLGTLAEQAGNAGYCVKILSGDRDLFQLVDADRRISVLYLSTAFGRRNAAVQPREFGPAEVEGKLGVLPEKVVDYKALCGDSSDNIPGVRGVGPKTAVQLLKQYETLDGIYASLESVKGALKKKLESGKEEAYRSQSLARIVRDIDLDIALKDLDLQACDRELLDPLLTKLEFQQGLRGKIEQLQARFGAAITVPVQEKSRITAASGDSAENDETWFFSADETETAQKQSAVLIEPQIIDTPEKLTALIAELKTHTDPQNPVAWDTETTSLEPRDAQLVGVGCCWGSGPTEVAYLPIGHKTGQNLQLDTVLNALRPLLEDPTYPKALQNAKYDRLVLRCQGIHLDGVVFDTMLASYVLNPEGSHNLSDLTLQHLGLMTQSYQDLVPKGQTIADVAIPAAAIYCGMDAYTVFCLVPKLKAQLQEFPDLKSLLKSLELPLEPVLAEMEYCGIRIDLPYLNSLSQELERDLTSIEKQAYAAAGEEFNLGSPKQLSQLLFETLGLDKRKSRKTKLGYSTDAATLEKLQGSHPVVDAILEYRTLSKLKSTYVDALPALVRADTERVHTDFNQAITATGRLSSSNPNLQNIPIRTAFSRRIRKAFVPEPGWQLVAADYSQIELRILAHLSGEPVLIDAYQNRRDVHTLTTQLLLEKETITAEERRLGKTINFGIIYGMGAQRFARATGVSTADAKLFIERFNQRYPKVFDYLQWIQQCAIVRGYVETIFGRRRYVNFTSDSLRRLRDRDPASIDLDDLRLRRNDAAQLRAAANAPIQGSSADIIKIAMIRLHQLLQPYQSQLLLQVHDELVFEMPLKEWETLHEQIPTIMETAVELKVPLAVEINAAQNWMDTK